jgi:hypothetical protein
MAKKILKNQRQAEIAKEKSQRLLCDSVFKLLFSDIENVMKLYTELSGSTGKICNKNSKISIETLTDMTLSTSLRNDLGFSVTVGKESRLYLVEAQSTPCPNIGLRMNEYLVSTYRQYIHRHKLKDLRYDKQKTMHLPAPEFYVIASYDYGPSNSRKKEYTFSEMFDSLPKSKYDFTVFVIDDENKETISGQYVGFCKIYKKFTKKRRSDIKSKEKCGMNNKTTSDQTNNQTTDDQTIMREVIEECQSKGYLVSFLEKHQNELENIMIEEMEYEESFDEYMERALNKAKKEGRKEGRKEAVEEAVKKAEPRIAKEAVKKAEPRIAKEAVKKAEPEIVRNYIDKLHRYLNSFKEGKMTKEAAAEKLDMTLAQFETLFC